MITLMLFRYVIQFDFIFYTVNCMFVRLKVIRRFARGVTHSVSKTLALDPYADHCAKSWGIASVIYDVT